MQPISPQMSPDAGRKWVQFAPQKSTDSFQRFHRDRTPHQNPKQQNIAYRDFNVIVLASEMPIASKLLANQSPKNLKSQSVREQVHNSVYGSWGRNRYCRSGSNTQSTVATPFLPPHPHRIGGNLLFIINRILSPQSSRKMGRERGRHQGIGNLLKNARHRNPE